MRSPTILFAITIAFLFSLQEQEVSAQIFSPSGVYGGSPLVPVSYRYGEDNDDDIGILLAVLLLAARNRGGCGGGGCCCNCCNCNNAKTVPVPFPIPVPTYNPIIQKCDCNDDDYDDNTPADDGSIPSEVINFDNENDDESKNSVKVKNDPKTSSAAASSNSNASLNRINDGNKPVKKKEN